MKRFSDRGWFCVWVWVVLAAGCSVEPPTVEVPVFREWYQNLQNQESEVVVRRRGELVTLSAVDMPLAAFVRELADRYGQSVVVAESLDGAVVNLEVVDTPVEAVLDAVARRLGVQATRSGGLWFLGELRPEDRAVLAGRAVRVDGEGLRGILSTVLSQYGRLQTFDDGVFVVADRVEVLERVATLVQDLEALPADAWVVQLHLTSAVASVQRSFGVEGVPVFDFALAAATSGGGEVARAAVAWQGVLEWTARTESVELVASPLLLVSAGSPVAIRDGAEFRIPRRVVSNEGTVTTVGYDVIQSGLDVEVLLRDVGGGRAVLDLRIVLGSVTGFLDELPIITRQELTVSPTVESEGVYLVGSLERARDYDERSIAAFRADENENRSVYAWARVHRINGGVKQ